MADIATETTIEEREAKDIEYFLGSKLINDLTEAQQRELFSTWQLEFPTRLDQRSLIHTGEIIKEVFSLDKTITDILDSAIDLLEKVIEVYDDEVERMNIFSFFEKKINSLWELRMDTNQNFKDIIVILEVAAKNSHYQNYEENQYKSIKTVLEKIKQVNISNLVTKECRKLLLDSGIDLFAPIRNWENYTIEIKKKGESE
jgi:hypothetical protein